MSTPIYAFPDLFEDLQKPASDFISGLAVHEPAIGKNQIRSTTLQADLDVAIRLDDAYAAVIKERDTVLFPAKAKAIAAGRAFVARAKKVLAVHLGADWTEQWGEAGFPHQSIQTPASQAGLLGVLKKLGPYFTTRPDHANPALIVTAERANALAEALGQMIAAVEDSAERRRAAKGARDKAVTTLRKRLRASIAELDLLIERDSEIWHGLGLTPPAQRRLRRQGKKAATAAAASGAAAAAPPASDRSPSPVQTDVSLAD